MTDRATILLVEDEHQMKRYVTTLLETADFQVLECGTAVSAVAMAEREGPDLILLDLGLPGEDGFEVIRRVRKWSQIPILVISAQSSETSKVTALDLGADDYLTKPFGSAELLARIRVALRHSRRENSPDVPELSFRNRRLFVDFALRQVFVEDAEIHLTPTEYTLLVFLIENTGKVLTHRQILKHVWGPGAVERPHYVRIFMANLRAKIEEDPTRPAMLVTETGVGYRFRPLT